MDLLSIIRAVWRHKLATIPVILLTAAGMFYVLAVKPPVYEATASFLLLSPPAAPTPAQVAKDPKLSNINANNPYVDLGNLSVVADAVLHVVSAQSSQEALVQAGADPRYQVALSTDFGAPPILQITGVGSSVQQAIRSANLVTQVAETDLFRMQKAQHVNDQYLIKPAQLVRPHQAQLSVSGKLRTLIAVLGLGAILLFVVVSVADAIEKRRADRPIEADRPTRAPEDVRAWDDALSRSRQEAKPRGQEARVRRPEPATAPPRERTGPRRPV